MFLTGLELTYLDKVCINFVLQLFFIIKKKFYKFL